jgi:hypothetical protein
MRDRRCAAATEAIRQRKRTRGAGPGNAAQPRSRSTCEGCCSVAPRWPHRVHRALRRMTSLDASGPRRMISGAYASARLCPHFGLMQWTQVQEICARSCASVGMGGGGSRRRLSIGGAGMTPRGVLMPTMDFPSEPKPAAPAPPASRSCSEIGAGSSTHGRLRGCGKNLGQHIPTGVRLALQRAAGQSGPR